MPAKVLYAHAGVVAFGVNHTAVPPLLLRWLEKSVDHSGVLASGAADEHGQRPRIVCGDSLLLSGGILGALRKKRTALHEAIKNTTGVRRVAVVGVHSMMLASAPAAASNLPLSFLPCRNLHSRFKDTYAVVYRPYA